MKTEADTFVAEALVAEQGASIKAGDLLQEFNQFWKARWPQRYWHIIDAWAPAAQLGKSMSAAGYRRTLTNGRAIYRGVRLR